MPKVYFVGSGYMGCNYVRCLMPQLYGGYNGSVSSVFGKIKSREEVLMELPFSDIIVFHRPDTPETHMLAMELKRLGKKIVFDNDDTASLDRGHPFYGIDEFGKDINRDNYKNIINNFILNADAVTTTTEFLANEYREINKNVTVLPNCIDPDDWGEPLYNESNKVRILISGSAAYTQDFEHVKDYLRELDARDDVQLILFGLWGSEKRKENPLVTKTYHKEYEFWDSLKNFEHVQWTTIGDYFETLRQLRVDIMLIPRKETYFNKCKSNIKFLESAMLNIPCVAQTFTTKDSPYDGSIDGTNGLLAGDIDDWKKKVDALILDKKLRREMGRRAHEFALENFNIKNRYHLWDDLYKTL